MDLNLTKALLNSVTSVLQDSSKVRAEQAKATNEQLAARYKTMPKPTSLEDAKVESYAAKAPERRVNDAIAAVYKKSVSEHAAQVKQESDAIKNAYAARGGVKPVAEDLSPKQKKHIDKNKNNKIDAHDFHLLRKSKMNTEASMDTPGNSYDHQCAIHVKHAKLGEGRTLFSQHAEPDGEGQIAWYDVMFAEGIKKKVPITDLEILVSESHHNHKKKKKM